MSWETTNIILEEIIMEIREVKNGFIYKYHHTAYARGYISRKSDGYAVPYSGKFGKGFKVYMPCWGSTRFCLVAYYVKSN